MSDRYELLDKLQTETTTGSCGSLFRAHDKVDNTTVVVRIIPLSSRASKTILDQLELTRGVEGIVPVVSHFVVKDTLWVLYPYYSQGSVYDVMQQQKGKRCSESMIVSILRQVLSTLSVLHEKGIAHGRLKASNILLWEDGVALLMDWGLHDGTTSPSYSYWQAPEAASSSSVPVDTSTDAWQVGTMTIEMATGSPPYWGFPPSRVLLLIRDHSAPILVGNFSSKLKSFVSRCVTKDKAQRPTCAVLQQDQCFTRSSLDLSLRRQSLSASLGPSDGQHNASIPPHHQQQQQHQSLFRKSLKHMVKTNPLVSSTILTSFQNAEFMIPNLSEEFIEEIKKQLVSVGCKWNGSLASTVPPSSGVHAGGSESIASVTTEEMERYLLTKWRVSSQKTLNEL